MLQENNPNAACIIQICTKQKEECLVLRLEINYRKYFGHQQLLVLIGVIGVISRCELFWPGRFRFLRWFWKHNELQIHARRHAGSRQVCLLACVVALWSARTFVLRCFVHGWLRYAVLCCAAVDRPQRATSSSRSWTYFFCHLSRSRFKKWTCTSTNSHV